MTWQPNLRGTNVLVNYLDPGWLKTDLGGPDADNAVETVLPGALVPAFWKIMVRPGVSLLHRITKFWKVRRQFDMLGYLFLGMTYAFAAAVQPGPFQAYLISQTISNGWRSTLPAAFAPLLSDGPIILVVLLVLSRMPSLAGPSLAVRRRDISAISGSRGLQGLAKLPVEECHPKSDRPANCN